MIRLQPQLFFKTLNKIFFRHIDMLLYVNLEGIGFVRHFSMVCFIATYRI